MSSSSEPNTKQKAEFNTPESWEVARDFARRLDIESATFTSTIRSLLVDQVKNKGTLSQSGRFLISRLLKTDSMRAPFYFATLTYRPNLIADSPYVSHNDLLNAYSPYELAFLLGLICIYKKAKKLSDPTEWGQVAPAFHAGVEIGGFLGDAIPKIGLINGLIAGGMQSLAFTSFIIYSPKTFKEYRRFLKTKNISFSNDYELKTWGCTSAQISSVIIQSIGLGIPLANSFTLASLVERAPDERADPLSYTFWISRVWIESFLNKGIVPEMTHKGDYYPLQAALKHLMSQIEEFRSKGPKHTWLERTKDEVNPQNTPQLFTAEEKAVYESRASQTSVEAEEEIFEELSDDADERGEE